MKTAMRVAYYIIHLSRAADRADNVATLRHGFNGPTTVIDAVDGSALTPEQEARYRREVRKPTYPFALNTAEIAVFLSHRKAWQQLLDDGVDAGIIVEDDILLDAEVFKNALALACEYASQGDIVRFPIRDRETCKTPVAAAHGSTLTEPVDVGLGMVLQLVTRNAAQLLLDATEQFDRPVDTFVQMTWLHDARPLTIWPSGVTEISRTIGGSTIHSRLSAWARLYREIMRPIYRARILRLQKRAARS